MALRVFSCVVVSRRCRPLPCAVRGFYVFGGVSIGVYILCILGADPCGVKGHKKTPPGVGGVVFSVRV